MRSSFAGDNTDIHLDPHMLVVGASSNVELHDFEHMSATAGSMDNAFQKRNNIILPYSQGVNENEDCYGSNPTLDLERIDFTMTDHTQFLPPVTTLGFDISGNENSAAHCPEDNDRNEVSTGSMMGNGGDFPPCPVDWNLATRPSLKTGDKTQIGSLPQRDLPSGGGTTLVLENLDSETRDEVLDVLFRHRRRIAFRIE